MVLIQGFKVFIIDLWKQRQMIWTLSVNDFKARFSGSFLGIIWAFVQPLVSILVYWFVFEVGFRSPPVDNVPFILWFTPAYISWIYFSDTLIYSSVSLAEYSYLVKKMNFRTSVLPVVKLISGSLLHMFFLVFVFFINFVYGNSIQLIWFQSLYYMLAMCILTLGLGFMAASIAPFFRDITQLIQVFLQIGFWLTPIFYNADNLSPELKTLMNLNPMFYIVRGYRDSFIYEIPFFERWASGLYFWIITMLVFACGALLFRKMRPHFADVL